MYLLINKIIHIIKYIYTDIVLILKTQTCHHIDSLYFIYGWLETWHQVWGINKIKKKWIVLINAKFST